MCLYRLKETDSVWQPGAGWHSEIPTSSGALQLLEIAGEFHWGELAVAVMALR